MSSRRRRPTPCRCAEYTLADRSSCTGKRVLERARDYHVSRTRADWLRTPRAVGNYRRTVGILSAS
ncbi:hydroxyacid dehydrogenase [Streptomyces violaceorubidus]